MEDIQIMYSEIKRFAVHDGPGIRSTLFLKGCPLHCMWCHNPEGMSSKPQVAFYKTKCLNYGECVNVCPVHGHEMLDGEHVFDRKLCIGCGKCEEVCLGDALKLYGRKISIDGAFDILMKDAAFYAGGGVTLSGGEPLVQAEACAKLLRRLKEVGIHTAVDTSGAVPWKAFEAVMAYTDLFLYDLKHIDSKRHRQLTGQGNELIIENLVRLGKSGATIEIRIPIIPGMNDRDEDINDAGKLLSEIAPVKVAILPYHSLAGSKYDSLEMINRMPSSITAPSKAHMQRFYDRLAHSGLNVYCSILE